MARRLCILTMQRCRLSCRTRHTYFTLIYARGLTSAAENFNVFKRAHNPHNWYHISGKIHLITYTKKKYIQKNIINNLLTINLISRILIRLCMHIWACAARPYRYLVWNVSTHGGHTKNGIRKAVTNLQATFRPSVIYSLPWFYLYSLKSNLIISMFV